jgi:cell division protein FtsI/penicillin-binding protein 2
MAWRINSILAFIFIFGLLLVGKLFFIQVRDEDFYRALAQGQTGGLYNIDEEILDERGEIFFKNGEPLAINMEWPLVCVSPVEIEEKEKVAEELARALGIEKGLISEKLSKNSLYEVIKKKISDEEIEKIKELDLIGVYLKKESGRYYPQGTLAAQMVGFLDVDQEGQYGLEEYYDEVLNGKKQKGEDLYLTIDYAIQFTAEELLDAAKENLDIEGGQIIVMEPDTGKILALANYPNFDPNQYSKVEDLDVFQNAVTQKIFEPGSVFKPITIASALEEEKITPQTTYVDEGIVQIGGYKIYNYDERIWGEKTMTEVLEKSINTGAVFAESQLGHNLFLKYLEKFGVFEPTDIDLQEIYSENKEFKKGYEINFATASFGQGIEMTPIQLMRAYSAIANGGKMVTPYIVENYSSGKEIKEVISPKTSSQLSAMLVSVVENGYAKTAQVPGYYVAGKTGTAQISYSALEIDKQGYSDKTWQSFMGFAPAFNPEFLILVKLDNPKTKTAEYSAVPIFHDLAKYIIDFYQIPTDY